MVRRICFRGHLDLIIYENKAVWALGIASNKSTTSQLI